ncbi:MAG: winged helix-turn-helix transcriptional regulator [Planctomycetaceae bacterium]|nr:winged helix-turn-helix transcriptional regulator [Planctomycetaceae bacterium]
MATKKLKLTDLEAMGEAAECLRTLAHPHRLRMIQLLLQGSFPVGELAQACGLPSAMASEHLRLMQRCGFLTSQKDGRQVFYQVAESHLGRILACIEERFGTTSVSSADLLGGN